MKFLAPLLSLLPLAANATLISSFQAGDASWHMGTFAVGKLDGTPDQQIVVPYRDSSGQWFIDAFKYNGQRCLDSRMRRA